MILVATEQYNACPHARRNEQYNIYAHEKRCKMRGNMIGMRNIHQLMMNFHFVVEGCYSLAPSCI